MKRPRLSPALLTLAVGLSGLATLQVGCNGGRTDVAATSVRSATDLAGHLDDGQGVASIKGIAATMPLPRAYHGVASLGDEMFLVGGSSQRTNVVRVDVFNVRSRTWRRAADLPTARVFLGVAMTRRSIYAVGGMNSSARQLATVEALDVDRNSWKPLPDLAEPRNRLAVVAMKGKIYAISGMAQTDKAHFENLPIVEEYDPSSGRWRRRADIPTPRHGHAAVVLDDRIYVIGGYGQTASGTLEELSTVEVFDPERNQWTSVEGLPLARGFLGAAAVDGRIYALGGRILGMPIESYDPQANKWVTLSEGGSIRQRFGMASFEKTIYVFGGEEESESLSVYDTSTNTWSP